MTREEGQNIVCSGTQKLERYSSGTIRRGLVLATYLTQNKTDNIKYQTQFWRCICTFTHPRKSIISTALSSDGQILALVDRWGIINICDLKNEKLLTKPYFCHCKEQPSPEEYFYELNLSFYNLFRENGSTFRLQFTQDNKTLISIGEQEVKFWNTGSGQLTQFLPKTLKFSVNLVQEIVAYSSHSEDFEIINIWDFRNKNLLHTLNVEFDTVESIALSSDGQFLAASGETLIGGNYDEDEYINEHSVKIFSLFTGETLHIINKHVDTENIKESPSIFIAPDNRTLISIETGCEDHNDGFDITKIYDLHSGELLHTLELGSDYITLTKDRKLIACSTDSEMINVWNLGSGELLKTLVGHDDTVNCFAISPDSQTLISGSQDGAIIIWNFRTGKLIHKLEEHWSSINSIEIYSDGQRFVSTDADGTIKVWKLSQYKTDGEDLEQSQDFEFQLVSDEFIEVNLEELLEDGLNKYNEGNYKGAVDDFTQVLNYEVNNVYAYVYRGNARSALGDQQGAIEDYTQVININSNYAEVYNDRGLMRAELCDYSGAIEDYTQALRIYPNLLVAYFNRGRLYSQLDDVSRAIDDYNQALQINPNYLEIYIYRGTIHARLGNYSAALEDFEQALRIDTEFAKIYINKINDALTKQDMKSAMQLITQNLINHGDVNYASGDYTEAIEAYTQVLSIEPNNTEAYNRRSTARCALGDYHGAMEDLQQAINPSSVKGTDYQLLDYLRLLAKIMQ